MRSLLAAVVLAGCGSPKHTAAPRAPAPAPVAVVTAPDPGPGPADPADPNGPAAAVPIPDDSAPPPLALIDTTITDDEVKAITGWPKATPVASGGEVWVVLHSTEDEALELALVRDNEGVRASYPLGNAMHAINDLTYDGDALPARDHTGDYQGPIVFAARVTAPGDRAVDQVVVFADGTLLKAARRPLGAKAWRPLLALAFRKGTTFRGIGTTDPH